MLQEHIVVEVEKRLTTGKNAANRLRAQDQIPAVLYGGGKDMETWSLQVPRKTLATLLNKGLHGNAIFKLNLKGTEPDAPRHDPRPHARPRVAEDAARRLRARASRPEAPRQERDRDRGRGERRQERGRHPEHRHARDPHRVPSRRHSGVREDRRLGDGDPRLVPRVGPQARRQDQGPREGRPRPRARRRAEGRGSRRCRSPSSRRRRGRRRRSGRRARSDQEGQEGRGRRRARRGRKAKAAPKAEKKEKK